MLWQCCACCMALPAQAQRFFNLTSQEVKVDSVLPQFVYSLPLQGDYQDSIYTVTVKYPEYVDMPATDISHYNRLSGAALPEQVAICQQVTECRKQRLLGDFLFSFRIQGAQIPGAGELHARYPGEAAEAFAEPVASADTFAAGSPTADPRGEGSLPPMPTILCWQAENGQRSG